MTPGRKFSTTMSASATSLRTMSRPWECFRFTVTDCLLRDWTNHHREVPSYSLRHLRRGSPPSGDSIFTTSAPNSAQQAGGEGPGDEGAQLDDLEAGQGLGRTGGGCGHGGGTCKGRRHYARSAPWPILPATVTRRSHEPDRFQPHHQRRTALRQGVRGRPRLRLHGCGPGQSGPRPGGEQEALRDPCSTPTRKPPPPSCAPPRKIALAVQDAFGPEGITILQANRPQGWQTVPHLHLHVLPPPRRATASAWCGRARSRAWSSCRPWRQK